MSTIMRRRRGSRRQLGPYKRYELLMGHVSYPILNYDGYGDGVGTDLTQFISDGMRRQGLDVVYSGAWRTSGGP